MNWFEVWTHVRAALLAEPELGEVVGDRIYLEGDRALELPSVEVMLVVDTEDELFAPVDWQFDVYTWTQEEALQVERVLRRRLNRAIPVRFGPALLWTELLAGRERRGPERDPYFRRSLDFRITPVRSRYFRPAQADS